MTSAARTTPPRAPRGKWQVLGAVGATTLVIVLNASMLNVAVPSIGAHFQAAMAEAEWVLMAYLLVIASLMLTAGRLADTLGFRRVYLWGAGLFAAGTLFCGLAPSIGWLIAMRVVQGLGAGMIMAAGPAILSVAFPAAERGKALGFHGTFVAAALGLGPILGGLLLKFADWRFIFYLGAPLSVLMLVWCHAVLADSPPLARRFDVAGAVIFFLAMAGFLLVISRGREWGWHSGAVVGLAVGAAVLFPLFIWRELHCAAPMMDLHLFQNRLFAAGMATALICFITQHLVIFLLPFVFTEALHLEPARMGLLLSSFPLTILVASPVSGVLSDRFGSRGLSSLGLAISTVGLLWLSRLGPADPWSSVVLPLAVLGLGAGIFQSPNSNAILGGVSRANLGVASGMLATARTTGMVLGVALAGLIFNQRLAARGGLLATAGGQTADAFAATYTAAFGDTMIAGALLAALGVVISLVRGAGQTSPAPAAERRMNQ